MQQLAKRKERRNNDAQALEFLFCFWISIEIMPQNEMISDVNKKLEIQIYANKTESKIEKK